MSDNYTLNRENFDKLLRWFSDDREAAALKYEEIRKGLIRFFHLRGCADPPSLADETFNRVALKISNTETEGEKIPLNYIYGFAVNVHHEYVRLIAGKEVELNSNLPLEAINPKDFSEPEDSQIKCLKQCLGKLSSEESNLLVKYYNVEKSAKFELRKQLAETLSVTSGALYIKVFRLKSRLRKCIEKCLCEKNV